MPIQIRKRGPAIATLCAAAALMCAGAPAFAENDPFSVAITAGTGGIGAELGYQISSHFGLRATGSYFRLTHDVNTSDIHYHGTARPESFSLLADLYPFNSAFRFTAGGVYNLNEIKLVATPSGPTTIGNQVYTPAQLGQINGHVGFRDISPYAGIGVTTHRGGRGWGFTADAGVIFSGAPQVTLTSTGPFSGDPTFQSNLALERQRVADKIDWLRYYPIVKVGVVYRF